MRIVLFGPAYPLRGGIAQFLAVLHEKLVARGHEVKFVSFIKQFPEWLFPGKTQLESSQEFIDVKPVARFAPLGMRSWYRTYKEIAAFDPDLVLFKWWMPFFGPGYWAVARWLRRHTRAKIVYTLDNVIPHESRPGDRLLSNLAFSEVDGAIALSRVVERDFFEWYPRFPRDRVVFSPHPIYDCYPAFTGTPAEARAAAGLDPASRWLLFFGFVRHYKGLDLLLEALPRIRQTHPDVKLVVVGEFYSPRAEFDRQIARLGLTDAVVIRDDYCPNEKVGMYFTAADAVVLPYRSATQSGIVQVAYALETPVITTDVGGLSEVVMEEVTGLIVPPEDPPALARAVERFYASGGRPAYTANIRREAHRFGWDGFVEAFESFGHPSAPPASAR